jgi:hypothetical protein
MKHHRTVSFTRRQFLAAVAAGSAGLALAGALRSYGSNAAVRQRHIWAFSDCHIGCSGPGNDGRDGGDWLALAVAEQRKTQPQIDYVLALGDLSDSVAGQADQLKRYGAIRDTAEMGPWFEIVGNHDFSAVPSGDWEKFIGRPTRYTLVDGNTAFICASTERGSGAGLLSPPTIDWMAGELDRCKNGNVIVCTHQPPADTVYRSDQAARCLHNDVAIAKLIEEHRIDLWLCGHIHAGPRNAEYVVRHGRTMFVNVASAGHAYGTGATISYTFSGTEGSRSLVGRCRDHERGRFLDDCEVTVDLPKPWALGKDAKPVLLPAKVSPATQPAEDAAALFPAEAAVG